MLDELKSEVVQAIKRKIRTLLTIKVTVPVIAFGLIIITVLGMFMAGGDSNGDGVDDEEENYGTDGMSSTSSAGFEQLVRWNAYMEHGIDIAKYTGDSYEFLADGYGGVAILGLDTRWFSDHFVKLGYSTSVGSKVPRDIVESYYREVIKSMYEEVKAKVTSSGCNMTEYQLYALTARRYNWGKIGENTISSYKSYWNQSRDDKYSQRIKQGDYSHKLYSQCLCEPSNGGVLTRRRKEEWDLFQCGYFSLIDEWYTEPTAVAGDASGILASAEKIHKYMEDNKYIYSLNTAQLASTFESSKTYKATCCASYVSWVLLDAGLINTCSHNAGGVADILSANSKFEKIQAKSLSDLKAGDILVYASGSVRKHTEIYAGNGTIYNAGYEGTSGTAGGVRGSAPASMNTGYLTSYTTYAFRLKAQSKTEPASVSQGGYSAIHTSGITGKKFKEFKQNSQGYNYPAIPSNCSWSSECGTVSTIIIGSGYDNKVSIKTAADLLYSTSGHTDIYGYMTKMTGKSTTISGTGVNDVTKMLKNGYVGIIHNPGYSSRGHYVAIIDISSDGKKVYIANPDVYGSATGGNNGATKNGWNDISTVCNAIDFAVWVK